MRTRKQDNRLKLVFLIICMLVMVFESILTNGQSAVIYKGFEVNAGVRTGTITSDIAQINGSKLIQHGGRIGLVYGTNLVRTKIGFGYFSSGTKTKGTIDLLQPNASVNVYPLAMLFKKPLRLEPYITGTLTYNNYKFYGYYLNEDGGNVNYSNMEAPYLGATRQLNSAVGIGLEFKILDQYDFIHLFSEMTYGYTITATSSIPELQDTHINKQAQVKIGLSFGAAQR